MAKYFFIFLAALVLSYPVRAQDKDLATITTLIQQQQEAWNKADINGFMRAYWQNDSLMFIGKNGIKYGWTTTLNNYKKNYPTADAMGKLNFILIKLEKLSEKAITVTGKWELIRKEGNIGGYFTLLWKKINGQWVIVEDHTS